MGNFRHDEPLKEARSLPDLNKLANSSHPDIVRMKLDATKDLSTGRDGTAQCSNDVLRNGLGRLTTDTAEAYGTRERKISQPKRPVPIPDMYNVTGFPTLDGMQGTYAPKDAVFSPHSPHSQASSRSKIRASQADSPSISSLSRESSDKKDGGFKGKQLEERSLDVLVEQSNRTPELPEREERLESFSRANLHEMHMYYQSRLILREKKIRMRDLFDGGPTGPKKVVKGYLSEMGSEGDFRNEKIKMPKAEIHELLDATKRLITRSENIERRRFNVAKDLYQSSAIPKEFLGDELIKKRGLVDEIDDLKERVAPRNDESSAGLRRILASFGSHVEKCVAAGEENFSDFVGMKTQILQNSESLYHYFDKYEKASIVIHYHNKKIRRMRDIFTASDSTINGMITNLGWSEINTQNRFQPVQSELLHHPRYIPPVMKFYSSLRKGAARPVFEAFPPTQLDKMSSYLNSSSDIVRKNPKSVSKLTQRLNEHFENRRSAKFPEKEALEKIKASIEAYASSTLEKHTHKVATDIDGASPFKEKYDKSYAKVKEDIKIIERFVADIKDGTYKGMSDQHMHILEVEMEENLNRLVEDSKRLRLNVATEVQNAQADCQHYFNVSHQDILFRNMEEYSRALRSFGNVVQKLTVSVISGAAGHAAAGFPNA